MSKLIITYDATEEIGLILKYSERHADMKMDDSEFRKEIHKLLQDAFNQGRRFQKQMSCSSSVKDMVANSIDI